MLLKKDRGWVVPEFANSATQQQKLCLLSVLPSQISSPRGHKKAATDPGITCRITTWSGKRGCFFPYNYLSAGVYNIPPGNISSYLTVQNCLVCLYLNCQGDGITLMGLNQSRLVLQGQGGAQPPLISDGHQISE